MALYIVNSLDGFGTFTATTGEDVTAGSFVKSLSTSEITATSTVVDKIIVTLANAAGDEKTVVGLALTDAANGEIVSIATRGIFRFSVGDYASHAPIVGAEVQVSEITNATQVSAYDPADGATPIGQFLTPANADADYVVVRMDMGNGAGAVVYTT